VLVSIGVMSNISPQKNACTPIYLFFHTLFEYNLFSRFPGRLKWSDFGNMSASVRGSWRVTCVFIKTRIVICVTTYIFLCSYAPDIFSIFKPVSTMIDYFSADNNSSFNENTRYPSRTSYRSWHIPKIWPFQSSW
jgi:hypothetical protein